MSIFGSIMGAIFGHGAQAKTAEITTTAAPGTASASTSPASTSAAPGTPAAQTVDVAAIVDKAAAATGEKLDWRTSIVDLMKLLGLDSSLESRRELATELGCPPDQMADTAQMNMWLHRAVMKKLAENGGSIPPELLH